MAEWADDKPAAQPHCFASVHDGRTESLSGRPPPANRVPPPHGLENRNGIDRRA